MTAVTALLHCCEAAWFTAALAQKRKVDRDTWVHSEPDYSTEDAKHAAPMELHGVLMVRGLTAGVRYALLRYEESAAVPPRHFLRTGGWHSRTDFLAGASGTHERFVRIWSNSTVFFRCVQA